MTSADDIFSPARDAGTLIILRPRKGDGLPEILMTERAAALRFAGGAMVFPGGGVDDGDKDMARNWAEERGQSLPLDDIAARIAAVRETIEETGLAVNGAGGVLPCDLATRLRSDLCRGLGLAGAIAAEGEPFDFAGLVPFSRWCPRPREVKIRYDTRFYLAVVEGGYDDLVPDGQETASLLWVTAKDMLVRADAEQAHIIFPTRCNLERIAQFDSIEAVLDHARGHTPELISPWVEIRDGQEWLCIPEGCGYPVTSRILAPIQRQ